MVINKRNILKNIFSLSIAEVFNKGITFVTLAYLTRLILPEGIGIIGSSNSIMAYLTTFGNFGLHIIGTKEISRDRQNINKYVNSINTIRLVLASICYLLIIVLSFTIPYTPVERVVLWLIGLNLFSNAIGVDWAYQGIERMEFLAVRQVITSTLNLIGTYLLVKSRNDIVPAVAVTVVSTALNSVWLLLLYIKMFGKFKLNFDFDLWKKLIKPAASIAFATISIIIFHNLNIIVLKFAKSNYDAGIYTIVEKIILLAILPTTVLQSSFFPLVCRAASLEEKKKIMKKFSILVFFVGSIISFGIFTFSDFIVVYSFGVKFAPASYLTKIVMFGTLLSYINVSYTPAFYGWNLEKQYFIVITAAGIISVISTFLLIPMFGTTGAAYSNVISELALTVGMSISFYKHLGKLFLPDLLKFMIYSGIACGTGYLIMTYGVHAIIAGIISLLIFAGINFAFKTITISELKGYIAK